MSIFSVLKEAPSATNLPPAKAGPSSVFSVLNLPQPKPVAKTAPAPAVPSIFTEKPYQQKSYPAPYASAIPVETKQPEPKSIFRVVNTPEQKQPDQLTISQGKPDTILDKVYKLFEPVTNVLTGSNARERENAKIARVEGTQEPGMTTIKVPFQKKQIGIQKNFMTDFAKWLVEFPERISNDISDTVLTSMGKGVVEPNKNINEVKVNSYLDDANEMYKTAVQSGMDEKTARTTAVIYGVGQGLFDISIIGGLLEQGAKGLLKGEDTNVARKEAWELLNQPKDLQEAKLQKQALDFKYHPDKNAGVGDVKKFQAAQDAYKTLQKYGVPSAEEGVVMPTIREYARNYLKAIGAEVPEKTSLNAVGRKLLPEPGEVQMKKDIELNLRGYQTNGGRTAGTEAPSAYLRDVEMQLNTPTGQNVGKETVDSAISKGVIKPDADGYVKLYRVSEPSLLNDLYSATYSKNVAEGFSHAYGQPITEIKVKPEEIKYVVGGADEEVLLAKSTFKPSPEAQIAPQEAPVAENDIKTSIDNSISDGQKLQEGEALEKKLFAKYKKLMPERQAYIKAQTEANPYHQTAEQILRNADFHYPATDAIANKNEFTVELRKFGYSDNEIKQLEKLAEESPVDSALVDLNKQIEKKITKFRKEAGLMASNEGAGVRYYKGASGQTEEKLYSYFKLSAAKSDMKERAEAAKKYAHELMYENDPEYQAMIDKRDELLAQNLEKADNEIDVAKMFAEADTEEKKLTQNIYEESNNGAIQSNISEEPSKASEVASSETKGAGEVRPVEESQSEGSLGFKPKNVEDIYGGAFTKEVKTIIKRSGIAKELSKKLGVPIRRGKFRSGGAIGIFKQRPEIVRIKQGGLATIFHEVGHFLDQHFEFSLNINATERKALMQEYGNSYAGNVKKQRQEAFAEFLRLIMTGQTEKALEWAPEFYNEWEGLIGAQPEIKQVIDTATEDFKRWKEMPSTAKVLSQISIGGEENKPLVDRFSQGLHSFYTMALDDLHPLSEFSKIGEKALGKISAEKDPYLLARNLRGWVGKANTFLTKGTFGKDYWIEKDGKIKANFKGKSFQEIMLPIERAKKLDDFRVYLVAKRANELAERKIVTGIAQKDAQTAVAELIKKHPEFEDKAQELYKYQDELLQYAADNGLTGPKGLERIKELNKMRVPFYRVMEEVEASGYMGKKKMAGNIGNPIKKIKGSEREIIDPIESIIKDTYSIVNVAERNNIGVAMANLSTMNKDLGRLFEKVDKPMAPTQVNVKEVLSKVSGINLAENPEMIALMEDLGNEMVTIFKPMQDRGPNMLNVNLGDKQGVFQVEPDLFKAIQGLNAEDVGMIFRILSMPARTLRAGATLTPDFFLRNPLRDQFSALVYSKYGFKPGLDLVRGIFELFKKGDVYDLWRMGGGEHSMLVSLDRAHLQDNYKELMRSKTKEIIHNITHPLEALQIFSEITEQATRLGEMRRALASGQNPVQAAYDSREITLDFARIGAKTKAVNSIIAFFNANVQGQDKLVRAFKARPFQTLFKVLMGLTLPSVLLYFANRKDPRWKEIPQWQKDLFWIVLTPKHIWRIPKPFEVGILFASVPERVLEFLDTKDSKLFTELEQAVANGATPGFIPSFLQPIIENITNYSFFLDRPIIPQGTENLPPEAQTGTYTSETAKILGDALNYSPSKIDNLIYGYSGGLGKYVTQGLDKIIVGTGIKKPPVAPEIQLEDVPVIKAFMIRPPVGTSSESVNRVYDLYGKASGELSYVNKLVKEGREEDAKTFIKQNPDVVYGKMLNQVIQKFSDINQARDQIRNSKILTAKAKQEKIQQLDELETKAAQKVLETIGKND